MDNAKINKIKQIICIVLAFLSVAFMVVCIVLSFKLAPAVGWCGVGSAVCAGGFLLLGGVKLFKKGGQDAYRKEEETEE